MRRIISDLLARELKDPAFENMISITHVKATNDGSFANVYFTCLGSEESAVIEGFEKAKGFIRTEIGKRLGIRRAPELRFSLDETEMNGLRIDTLLNELDLPEKTENYIMFDELSEIIDAYKSYFIFTHIHLDGDTLGASVAFAEAMREIGRDAWVVIGDEVPRTLEMIKMPYVIDQVEAAKYVNDEIPYLSIAMDFTDPERMEGREELFFGAEETLSIDHHAVSKPECDYNYIEPEAAATAEIMYRFLKSSNLPLTERIATALYVGIVTDTGRFQYANTTPEIHRIAAELIEANADFETAYREIYQSVKAEKLYVQSAMLDTLEIFAGGKAALAYVRADTLAKLEAGEDETDGMSELLRGIIGIEVAAFLKELPDGKVKVSMRSKGWLDVASFAAEFGGGGHLRAAGFSSDQTIEIVCATLKKKLIEALSK